MYAIELLGSMSTDEARRHLRTLHLYPEYIDLPECFASSDVLLRPPLIQVDDSAT